MKKEKNINLEEIVNSFFNNEKIENEEKILIKIHQNSEKIIHSTDKILNSIEEINDRLYDIEEIIDN